MTLIIPPYYIFDINHDQYQQLYFQCDFPPGKGTYFILLSQHVFPGADVLFDENSDQVLLGFLNKKKCIQIITVILKNFEVTGEVICNPVVFLLLVSCLLT